MCDALTGNNIGVRILKIVRSLHYVTLFLFIYFRLNGGVQCGITRYNKLVISLTPAANSV